MLTALQSMSGSSAYMPPRSTSKPHKPHKVHSRRDLLHQLILAPIAIPSKSHALEQCKAKSHNCIRTTWIAPPSMSSNEAISSIRNVINSYPQEGQAGVDCNGWLITNDSLDKEGKMALEFKSCVGPAAIAINLAQPFIDDLKLELDRDSSGRVTVEVKSNSRMGSSDLFVNRKRLLFLGDKLRNAGWTVGPPKYVYEM
eukprot:scaffold17839_cov72-Cyclotella_meneghiniana.AAC.10